jgi:hypothetical protein
MGFSRRQLKTLDSSEYQTKIKDSTTTEERLWQRNQPLGHTDR